MEGAGTFARGGPGPPPVAPRAGAPPTPRGNRLLGLAPELQRSQIRLYERVMREHGDVVRLTFGPPGMRSDFYCVFHPDGVQRVLAGSRQGYSKMNRFYERIAADFGWGLLTSEGETWRRHRRLIQPLFTARKTASYARLMAEEAAACADRLDRAAANGGVVDAHEEMVRLALQVVGRAVFGEELDRAMGVLDSTFPVLNRHTWRRATSPVRAADSWPTPDNLRAARARRELYAVVDELIARRRRGGAAGDDLVSRLLRARDPETGEAMDEQEVRDEALVFLLAGHETTATALTFTLHLLGRHPHEQERVRTEVDEVLGGRLPTAEDGPALARTTMVIKEAMRLYPPAYAVGRLSLAEDEIGGYRIPANAWMVVCQWATHRHPDFWPDPEAFDPDRFAPDREAGRHRYAYFPFGAGPRACIGSHFAMLEAVIAIAVLLQRFRLGARPGDVALNTKGLTLRPEGAVPIELARP